MIKLNPRGLVETVMVTVILIVIVDLAMTVAVTMVVAGAHHVVVVAVGIASSVGNLVILLESALLGMVGEEIDMVVGMIGTVVVVVVVVAVMDQIVVVIVVVIATLAAAVMVAAMVVVTVTAVTDLVPTDGLYHKKYVPSRYGSLSTVKVCYRVSGSFGIL